MTAHPLWLSRLRLTAGILAFVAFCFGVDWAFKFGVDELWMLSVHYAPWAPGLFIGWVAGMLAFMNGASWRSAGCVVLFLVALAVFGYSVHTRRIWSNLQAGAWTGAVAALIYYSIAQRVEAARRQKTV